MTTAAQWEHMAREANAAAVKAMAEAAGGQEKPNDRLPSIECSCRFHGPNGDHWDCGRDCGCDGPRAGWQWRTVLRAALAVAPIGGQAEPSDGGYRQGYVDGFNAAANGAAAVSGEQEPPEPEPTDRCAEPHPDHPDSRCIRQFRHRLDPSVAHLVYIDGAPETWAVSGEQA